MPGYNRLKICPACLATAGGERVALDARHVLIDCSSVAGARVDLGISDFIASCRVLGQDNNAVYRGYVMGRDSKGSAVSRSEHRDRGKALEVIQTKWLESWGAAARSSSRSLMKKRRVAESVT